MSALQMNTFSLLSAYSHTQTVVFVSTGEQWQTSCDLPTYTWRVGSFTPWCGRAALTAAATENPSLPTLAASALKILQSLLAGWHHNLHMPGPVCLSVCYEGCLCSSTQQNTFTPIIGGHGPITGRDCCLKKKKIDCRCWAVCSKHTGMLEPFPCLSSLLSQASSCKLLLHGAQNYNMALFCTINWAPI